MLHSIIILIFFYFFLPVNLLPIIHLLATKQFHAPALKYIRTVRHSISSTVYNKKVLCNWPQSPQDVSTDSSNECKRKQPLQSHASKSVHSDKWAIQEVNWSGYSTWSEVVCFGFFLPNTETFTGLFVASQQFKGSQRTGALNRGRGSKRLQLKVKV